MHALDIKEVLEKATAALFANQPNIFDFTSETVQTEWNLAHHLANEIHELLPELDCDLDVIKENLERKRPDIVFHKRGTNSSNFLVVEIKRDGAPHEIKNDIQKIKSYWFGNHLRYQFGAVINLRSRVGWASPTKPFATWFIHKRWAQPTRPL